MTTLITEHDEHTIQPDTLNMRTWSGSPQSMIMSVYETQMANQTHLVTITWCKNLLLHGLAVSVSTPIISAHDQHPCKVELKPWHFWRKKGSKKLVLDGKTLCLVWDLRAAKFNGEIEPQSDYYVAVVFDKEVVLVVGDMKKDAFKKTGCPPALVDPILVLRKENVLGKKKFYTKVKCGERGKYHEVLVEFGNNLEGLSHEMDIRIDGELGTKVKHLEWKFRGNVSIDVKEGKLVVFWDVHDWIFGSGPRHAMFMFKTLSSSSSSYSSSPSLSPSSSSSSSFNADCATSTSEFCLFLCAWKVE